MFLDKSLVELIKSYLYAFPLSRESENPKAGMNVRKQKFSEKSFLKSFTHLKFLK